MWFKHSKSIAQQLMPIYNTNVHIRTRLLLPLMWLMFVPLGKDFNMPKGRYFYFKLLVNMQKKQKNNGYLLV